MTHLRQIMPEELERRNYAPSPFAPTFARVSDDEQNLLAQYVRSLYGGGREEAHGQ